jgi:predicted transcriptional regulator
MADTEPNQPTPLPLAELTAEIVSAYTAHHTVAVSDLPSLIATVGQQLATLGQVPIEKEEGEPKPVVPIKHSVRQHEIICLICGKGQKMLKRHLATQHDLIPDHYRAMFGLRDDYPLVAPDYAAARSALAKKIGLGRKPEPKAAAKTAKTPVRKSPAKKSQKRRS